MGSTQRLLGGTTFHIYFKYLADILLFPTFNLHQRMDQTNVEVNAKKKEFLYQRMFTLTSEMKCHGFNYLSLKGHKKRNHFLCNNMSKRNNEIEYLSINKKFGTTVM